MTAAGALAARIAAFGLTSDAPLVERALDPADWNELTGRVLRERMEGMLACAVRAGAIAVSDEQMSELVVLARSRARADLILERQTLQAAALLDDAGVPFRLLKGPAWSHSAYPDPMMRGFGDVDLLIDPVRWYDAIAVMEGAGARRLVPELRPGFDGRFGKDATMVSASNTEIDLHRTLALGPYGFWLDVGELIGRPPHHVSIGGVSLPVLDPESAFLHACYNAVLTDDPPRLMALRDVAQMVSLERVSPGGVQEIARRWRAVAVVQRAFLLVERHLGLGLANSPIGAVFAGRPGVTDRVLMAAYRGPGRGYSSQIAALPAIRGTAAKASYLVALVRPQRAYLEARGWGRIGYVRNVIAKLRSK